MVQNQLQARGIRDKHVLKAMGELPRHVFVHEHECERAYDDSPLPIGHGQTISQPFIVAYMTELLAIKPTNSILEIGTGCGYQTAVLCALGKQVTSVELVPELAERARETLEKLNIENVDIISDDGKNGWLDNAPYDRIMVTAAPKNIPKALKDQLAIDGRMVIPAGSTLFTQHLWLIEKDMNNKIHKNKSLGVRFVPLV